jgi:hypothetical protein
MTDVLLGFPQSLTLKRANTTSSETISLSPFTAFLYIRLHTEWRKSHFTLHV